MRLKRHLFFAAFFLASSGSQIWVAAEEWWHSPAVAWRADQSWLGSLDGAIVNLCIAIAILRYRRRRIRTTSVAEDVYDPNFRKPPPPWPQRPELRFVLNVIAINLFIGCFGTIWNYLHAVRAHTYVGEGLWSDLVIPLVAYGGFGFAIIAYDRARYRKDWRKMNGRCLACGYDLRATPARYPECGSEASHPPKKSNVECLRRFRYKLGHPRVAAPLSPAAPPPGLSRLVETSLFW